MKLELKHLAPYLPYLLPILHFTEDVRGVLLGISHDEMIWCDFEQEICIKYPEYINNEVNDRDEYEKQPIIHICEIKPILRPLSDLTKEIEHNGKKFVPINKLAEIFRIKNNWDDTYTNESLGIIRRRWIGAATSRLPYWVIQKLFEWHFDVFGLIEAGLAIDINTLKQKNI